MNAVPEEERFAKNAIVMVEAIQDGIKRLSDQGIKTIDPMMIALVSATISTFDQHFLIQGFIENSHQECWDSIRRRDEQFFIENASSIFKFLPTDKVNLFRDVYTSRDANGNNIVPQNLKDQIWGIFDAMIKISIKYIHRLRAPYCEHTPEGMINCYASTFFDEVNLNHHALVWGVTLEFPSRY